MPNLRTLVTELGTGLGMLGLGDVDEVLALRPAAMRSLSPENWDQLSAVRSGGAYAAEFHAAWENGRAFLEAREALRGRRPEVVEWKGVVRATGDEVAPIDLRIDHVYLVSCKYLSNILFNVSPVHLFDDLLVGGPHRPGRGVGGDWYAEAAPELHQHLYAIVRQSIRDGDVADGAGHATSQRKAMGPTGSARQTLPGLEPSHQAEEVGCATVVRPTVSALHALPAQAVDLTTAQRVALGQWLRSGWPGTAKSAYEELSVAVSQASVARWRAALGHSDSTHEAMLWRLLRIGNAPYFVLGSSPTRSLRLRIATPWDWRQRFSLSRLEIFAQAGGQPRVGWTASVRARTSGQVHELSGHVEVRWSHGRFGGPPEAKGYIDTPHDLIPGYVPLV